MSKMSKMSKKLITVKGVEYERVELTSTQINANVCGGCVNEFRDPDSCDDFPICWTKGKGRKYYIYKAVSLSPENYQAIDRAIRAAEATKGPILIDYLDLIAPKPFHDEKQVAMSFVVCYNTRIANEREVPHIMKTENKMPKQMNMMMKIVADYQYAENYGYHSWDGEGECPQHWKMKGCTEELLFDGLTLEMAWDDTIEQMATEMALEREYSHEGAWLQFVGLSIVPSNQINRYDAMEAEMHEDYEYIALFDTQEVFTAPDENAPLDRFDAMAEELGMEGL